MADIFSCASSSGDIGSKLRSFSNLSGSSDSTGTLPVFSSKESTTRVVSVNLIKNFPHNFKEVTLHKPTFCDHCKGFIKVIRVILLHSFFNKTNYFNYYLITFTLLITFISLIFIFLKAYKCRNCGIKIHKKCLEEVNKTNCSE